jgi:hypothetical protein
MLLPVALYEWRVTRSELRRARRGRCTIRRPYAHVENVRSDGRQWERTRPFVER